MMIKGGQIQKANKKSLKAKGKNKVNGKGKDKEVYIPKPKNPKPTAMERPTKDDTCHHYKEVGHCKRNCHAYIAELIKKKKQFSTANSSDVFIIELFYFLTKSWVYDTSCGTLICNTKYGLGGVRKLKQVEAIGSFELVLPNGLVICLENSHYAPFIIRGVVSVHRLVENGFVQRFTDFGISVSKNNAIPSNGIYEIDMHDLVPNVKKFVFFFTAFCLSETFFIAFCLKTSLRFASRPHCVLLQAITAFCFNITAFCSRPPYNSITFCRIWGYVLVTAFWLLNVAFCLLEDLTAFCFKTSLRFASRPHFILLQDLTAFCFKTSLHFASSYHCILLQHHCVLLKTSIAFCLKTILRFDKKLLCTQPCLVIQMIFKRQENGLQILQSIDQGPFELGTIRDALGTTPKGGILLRPERPRTYEDLSDTEKKQYDADVRATNIVLQGLPKDIYKLINHNIEEKSILDNVKMLLAGSELTKEDRESQLYDEFERFKMLLSENINEYYVCFHKLVNGMRNIRITMPNIQLNSKFVNNMSLEWDRFEIAIKLNKVLDEKELLFLAGGNRAPLMKTSIFMANLSSVGSANPQAGLSNASILSEVTIYEQCAKFELTGCEQRMDDQMRNTIRELKEKISRLTKKNSDTDPIFDLKALVSQNKDLTAKLNALHGLNECFRAENAKVKKHYKELYDSIKIMRAKTTNHNNSLLSEIEHLKDQLKENSKCVTIPNCKPKVLASGRYSTDIEPIPPRLKKNQEVHLHYIEHLKENVETLRKIVEDAKVERPLDTSLASACRYTKHSQELLEYELKGASAASRSKPRSNTKKDRTLPAKSALKQVEAHSRMKGRNEKYKNRMDMCEAILTIKCGGLDFKLSWKDTGYCLPPSGHQWRPTGRILTFMRSVAFTRNTLGDQCL
ncbi:hypothetical protein Tco_0419108 [Tanacetum coccineum]